MAIIYVVIVAILLMDIGGYCINGYWWILVAIVLMDIGATWPPFVEER
jgi:hypothetical protein